VSGIAHQERLMQVLLGPHVSEKSTAVADGSNQVVFKVRIDATKKQIRQAVEVLFDVKVERVSVVRVAGKARRFGTTLGHRSDWKKAYVRLAPGSDLDFVGGE
jgi:large subunit ribosomal protein L23